MEKIVEDRYITVEDAAKIIGGSKPIAIRTMAYWRSEGTGPDYVKVGRAYRYSIAAIERWISANTVKHR